MHLRDRGGGDRPVVEDGEQILDLAAERMCNLDPRLGSREGLGIGRQPFEFDEIALGKEVLAQAQRLPGLDEARPQPLELEP